MQFIDMMISMKKIFVITLLALSFLISSCGEDKKEIIERDIYFFYLELCPGCESYEAAERISGEVLRLGGKATNIIHDDDAKNMKEFLERKSLGNLSHVLPLMVYEGSYYVGYEDIEAQLVIMSKELAEE